MHLNEANHKHRYEHKPAPDSRLTPREREIRQKIERLTKEKEAPPQPKSPSKK